MTVQLVGISNAIVDILTHVDDEFLRKVGAPPGSMTLIDADRAHEIYGMMGPATEMSGGSVANTIAGVANLGGQVAYVGRVKNDQFGEVFVHDMRSLGVDVRTTPADSGSPTARCYVLISEDGQRTMQTYLGACTELGVSDVTEETVGDAQIVLLEGYVWDIPEGPVLAARAIDIAKKNNARVALSLSDSFCVERHQQAYFDLVHDGVDIVFADEDEILALFGETDFDQVSEILQSKNNLFVVTRSAKGSVVFNGTDVVVQQAMKVDNVIDSTGAGDAYTAAFLYGQGLGKSLAECARLGTWCASNVIQQVGGRIEKDILQGYESGD